MDTIFCPAIHCITQAADAASYLNNFVEELEDHCDICVLFGDGDEVEIVVFDEGERDISVLYNGRHVTLLLTIHHQRHELVNDSHVYIAAIIPRNQHLPFQIQYVHN